MAVDSTINKDYFTGNGSLAVYTTTFIVNDVDDLEVYLGDTLQSSSYTSVLNANDTVTVTFSSAPASGVTITLLRATEQLQSVSFTRNSTLDSAVMEGRFDVLTEMIQDTKEIAGRALKIKVTENLDPPILPTLTGNTGYLKNTNGVLSIGSPNNVTVGGLTTIDTEGMDLDGVPVFDGTSWAYNGAILTLDTINALRGTSLTDTSVFIKGHTSEGDGGEGIFRLVTGAAAGTYTDDDGITILPGGGDGSAAWIRQYNEEINILWYGPDRTGIADSSSMLISALAAATDGMKVYIPSGIYRINRGDYTTLDDNITSDNISIFGDGKSTILNGYLATGDEPAGYGWESVNIFQATDIDGIEIRDLCVNKGLATTAFWNCSNVILKNITINGEIGGPGTRQIVKPIYLYNCSNVVMNELSLTNTIFGIYLSGEEGYRCDNIKITNSHFELTEALYSFPTGVYAYWSDNVIVSECSFKNMNSSVVGGNFDTGCGFGFYEGDGRADNLVVSNNIFQCDGLGLGPVCPIRLSETDQTIINGNAINVGTSGNCYQAISASMGTTSTANIVITNNILRSDESTPTSIGILIGGSSASNTRSHVVANNNIYGFNIGILSSMRGPHTLNNNVCVSQYTSGIALSGSVGSILSNNNISNSGGNSVSIYASPNYKMLGNTIVDGNTRGLTGGNGAAVSCTNYSYGSVIRNNYVGNSTSVGQFTYGFYNNVSQNGQIFKNVSSNNSFDGLPTNTQFYNYITGTPTNGIYDIDKLDYFEYHWINGNGGSNPGWYCTFAYAQLLTANASSASTTITVGSTSGFSAGDLVLLTKSDDPYDSGNYYDATWSHADTILSVTDGTHFVLTTGIPAGDGTYTSGTARVKIARLKAAAAMA